MSRIMEPPKNYKHQKLMDDFNDLMIKIKIYLFGNEKMKKVRNKPTSEEIDKIFWQIMEILQKDNEPFIKY